MAISKALISSLFVYLIVFHVLVADQVMGIGDPESASLPQKMDCGAACTARCQLSSRPRLCKRACGTCCVRCNCVPPGTSGNLEVCPCYANMTTHGNRRKCP